MSALDVSTTPGAAYREWAAPPDLACALECGWVLQVGRGADHVQRVLPDGCIDLVHVPHRGVIVAGPSTRAFLSTVRAGHAAVGVRFRPGAAPGVLGVPAAVLRDRSPDLGDLWGARGATASAHVADAASPEARLRALVALVRTARAGAGPPDRLVRCAVRRVAATPSMPVTALAADLGLSERQLRRRFDDAVGYGPKRLARILRLRSALAAARGAPHVGWLRHALEGGYVDHAHLVRDCRDLTGLTPVALVGSSGRTAVSSQRAVAPGATIGT
jgi:AraC-like DNA-binding protein